MTKDLTQYEYGVLPPLPKKLTRHERVALREHFRLCKDRGVEALKLYEPMPHQERLHRAACKEVLMIKGNQVGGTIATMAELARALTDQDPYQKYPSRDGVAACLVYGETHVGRVLYPKLFKWGAFDIIRDEDTDEYRTYRPWNKSKSIDGKKGDAHREHEKRPAPPLIPKRFIDGKFAWEKRAQRIFKEVHFTTGWTLYALNSQGDPSHAQGFSLNLAIIDEDVAAGGWISELIGRLSKPPGAGRFMKTGFLRWAALPHARVDDMRYMLERAEEEEELKKPRTVAITVSGDETIYLSEETRKENQRIWRSMGEEEYQRRWEGDMSLQSVMMYPAFEKTVNDAVVDLDNPRVPEALRILAQNEYVPPLDWCNYLSFDPGYNVGAVTFFTVPPTQLGTWKIQFDELYIRRCTAPLFGVELAAKTKNLTVQDFIIDARGAQLRQIGTGVLPRRQYERELEKREIACEVRGSRFLNGCDNIPARETALRTWLTIRESGIEQGYPTLMVVMFKCVHSVREMIGFKRKTELRNGITVVLDEANRRGHARIHTCEATEMLAAHGMPYVRPPTRQVRLDPMAAFLEADKIWRMQEKYDRGLHNRESGITLGPRGA